MSNQYSILQKSFAWSVHIFTASGLIAGFLAVLAIHQQDWRVATFWMLLTLVIDGVDGTFARMANVKEVLPGIDGKTIDYVIDFCTYAIIPTYFFYNAGLVIDSWALPLSVVILLVSSIYYGMDGMVSDDYYFIGFPVMWNMVMFFLFFVTDFSSLGNAAVIIFLAALHFLPIKFVYPSRAPRMQKTTILMTVIMLVTLIAAVFIYPAKQTWLTVLSCMSLAYFGLLAIYDTYIHKP